MKQPHLTTHAKIRWHERFGGDLWEAFGRAIPIHNPKNSNKSLYDYKSGAVFIMDRGLVIKTVLTKEQYTNTLRKYHVVPRHFREALCPEPAKPAPKKTEVTPPEPRKFTEEELEQLAKENVEKIWDINLSTTKIINKAQKEINALDITKEYRKVYTQFVYTYVYRARKRAGL